MLSKFSFSAIVILCAVIEINCWSNENSEYAQNKRAKYYSNPTYKYYKRPSYSNYNRGPTNLSYNGYAANDIGLPTSKLRPFKVSKRPINEGLGDEDFSNLIKYLSSKDLDKFVELATEKTEYANHYKYFDNDNDDLNDNDYTNDEEDFPRSNEYEEEIPHIYSNPNIRFEYNKYGNLEYIDPNTNYPHVNMNSMYTEMPIEEEPHTLPFLNKYIQKEINVVGDSNNIFTDSSTMKEEELPRPINLREDDIDVSFTNNVNTVAKPETSYRLENFANLPLMGYENSKLERVNSYSVPHYSVISSRQHRPRLPSQSPVPPPQSPTSLSSSILSLINAPEVEPAPPVSTAKEQSDAHLQAIKIWTHKSQGTAYTLHDDGTLSLENPSRPRRYKFP